MRQPAADTYPEARWKAALGLGEEDLHSSGFIHAISPCNLGIPVQIPLRRGSMISPHISSIRCHHADSIHRRRFFARPAFRRTHTACAGACGKSTDHRRHSRPHAQDAASGPSTRHHAEHYRASLHGIPRLHPSGDAPRNRQNRAQKLPHHRKQSQPRHVSPRAIGAGAPDRSRTPRGSIRVPQIHARGLSCDSHTHLPRRFWPCCS